MSASSKARTGRVGTSLALVLLTLLVATSRPVSTAPQAPAAPAGTAVVAVPWFGQESAPHQVYSGGQLTLQAVFGLPDGTPVAAQSATWDPGTGTPVAVSVANPRAIELTHTYTGADGQPFTATVTVTHASGQVFTDTFKVVIRANTRETRVNMAIDKGLWNLHKTMQFTTSDGQPSGFWRDYSSSSFLMAATASAVQAFQINGHRESHDATKDPYVANAKRGTNYVLSLAHGKLQQVAVSLQGVNNPDANGSNNAALWVYPPGGHNVYVVGQVIDALISSGTPNETARVGQATHVIGRTYKHIVAELLDGYNFGLNDNVGSWCYTLNDGCPDTSSSHWWAIGDLAAQTWNLESPSWVKALVRNPGIPTLQNATTGKFGYRSQSELWDGGINTTPAGLIMMNASDMPKTDARFQAASTFTNNNWNSVIGNFYSMFQVAKAMRTAQDGSGNSAPITLLAGTRDWYAGIADHLVLNQNAAGAFTQTQGSAPIQLEMATSWAIIMLSPSLFELPPTAACSVDASVVCQAGAVGGCNPSNNDLYATVNFSGTASTPGDNAIATYQWNFQDSTPLVSGATASHSFTGVGTYNVALTVTDTKGLASTVTCPVRVTSTAVPPVANAGGPYNVCQNRPASVILNASGSFGRGSNIELYEWDWTNPTNFTPANSTDMVTDQTAYFAGLIPGAYDVALRVTDNTPVNEGGPFKTTVFTTVTVRAANDLMCNVGPVATNNSYTTQKNVAVSGNAVTNGVADSDADGDAFTAAVVAAPAQGTLTFNASGAFTYTPPTGFDGTVTFTYRLTDTFNAVSNTATVTIVVLPNVDPTAAPDAASTQSGTPVTVVVLTNDNDADPGQTLTVTGTSGGPANGSVTVNGDGTITYTPTTGFAGVDTFTYSISDGNGGTASALVTITVTKRTAVATATGGTFTYDGTPHAGGCAVVGGGGETLTGTITYSSGGAPVDAGGHTVTCSFSDPNYDSATDTASITINPAAASVSANSYTRSYLAPDPAFAGVMAGFVAADGISATYTSTGAGLLVPGVYPTMPTLVDPNGRLGNYVVTSTNGTLTITNTAPVCNIAPSMSAIWPPNHKMVAITASGATDVDGGPLTYAVVSIFQDEPTNTTGDGNTAIDGAGVGTSTAQVRAERTGDPKNPGNGRVYHITFSVTDSLGLSCQSTVKVGVPHDQSGKVQPIDEGPIYNSTVAGPAPAAAAKGKGN